MDVVTAQERILEYVKDVFLRHGGQHVQSAYIHAAGAADNRFISLLGMLL